MEALGGTSNCAICNVLSAGSSNEWASYQTKPIMFLETQMHHDLTTWESDATMKYKKVFNVMAGYCSFSRTLLKQAYSILAIWWRPFPQRTNIFWNTRKDLQPHLIGSRQWKDTVVCLRVCGPQWRLIVQTDAVLRTYKDIQNFIL